MTDQRENNTQAVIPRHEDPALGAVYLGGLSVGDRCYLGYSIQKETTFNSPSYLGDPHCNRKEITNTTADAEGTVKHEESYRTETDSESDFRSQDSTFTTHAHA